MIVAEDELTFPGAREALRAKMFDADFAPPLTAEENARLTEIRSDLTALGAHFKHKGTVEAARRYLQRQILQNELDALTLPALNTELEACRPDLNRLEIYPPDQCALLYATAAVAEAALKTEAVPLEEKRAKAAAQCSQSDERMKDVLLLGTLPFYAINHTAGDLCEGNPKFWRSDAAPVIWNGGRARSDGSNGAAYISKAAAEDSLAAITLRLRQQGNEFGAIIKRADLEAYFAKCAAGPTPGRKTASGRKKAEDDLRAAVQKYRASKGEIPVGVRWKEHAKNTFNISGRQAVEAWDAVADEFPELSSPANKPKKRREGFDS
jgi:hypothetical protein